MGATTDEILLRLRLQGGKVVEAGLLDVGHAARSTGTQVDRAARSARRGAQSFAALRASSRGVSGSFGVIARGAAGAAAALGGIYAVGGGLKFAFDEATEAAKVGAQTAAVIKSTGGAARVSAKHVGDLANQISVYSGIDDEAIQSGENMLLTFTRIRNEAGKGNDVFDQATRTIMDMSVSLGQDARTSAIQLGKALNDPVAGVSALRKVGVSFTDDTKRTIRALVERGRVLEAQKIILRELTTEFAGSARAQAQPMEKLRTAFGQIAETVGTILLPYINRAADAITRFLLAFNDSGKIQLALSGVRTAVGDTAAMVKDWLIPAGAEVIRLFRALPGPAKAAVAAIAGLSLLAGAGPLGIVGGLVAGAVLVHKHWDAISRFFSQLWSDIQTGVRTGVGAALRWLGDQFGVTGADVKQMWQAIQNVAKLAFGAIRLYVGVFLAWFKPVFEHFLLPSAKRTFTGIVNAVKGMARIVGGVIKVVTGLLTLDFGKAWEGVKQIFGGATQYLIGIFQAVTAPARSAIEGIWKGLGVGVTAAFDAVKGIVIGAINELIKVYQDTLGKVPGAPDIGLIDGGSGGDDVNPYGRQAGRRQRGGYSRGARRFAGQLGLGLATAGAPRTVTMPLNVKVVTGDRVLGEAVDRNALKRDRFR